MISDSSSTSRWIGARSASTMRRRSAAVRACSASDVSTATVRAPRWTAIEQPGGDEVAERIVEFVGESAECGVGILVPERCGEPADGGSDDRRCRGNGRRDRPDRLVAGEEDVAEVLDPRGEGVGALDVVGASRVAALERGHPVPRGRGDHDRRDHPTRHGEHDDAEPGRPCRTSGVAAVEAVVVGGRSLGVRIVDRNDRNDDCEDEQRRREDEQHRRRRHVAPRIAN